MTIWLGPKRLEFALIFIVMSLTVVGCFVMDAQREVVRSLATCCDVITGIFQLNFELISR